jgi:hypothetical protein
MTTTHEPTNQTTKGRQSGKVASATFTVTG